MQPAKRKRWQRRAAAGSAAAAAAGLVAWGLSLAGVEMPDWAVTALSILLGATGG